MNIVAKFQSRCPVCDCLIRAGERVEWSRGEPARHLVCAQPRPKAPAAAPAVFKTEIAPAAVAAPVAAPVVVESDPWSLVAQLAAAEAVAAEPVAAEPAPVAPVPAPATLAPVVEIGSAIIRPRRVSEKRPRPYVVEASAEDLAWDPEARPLHTFLPENESTDGAADETCRAGELFAIVRPGMARWPLSHGAPSKYYRVYSHNRVHASTMAACSGQVTLRRSLIVGQGTHVIHEYDVAHLDSHTIDGAPVTSRLAITVPHTGKAKLRANIVVYIGKDAIGSCVGAKAAHRANNPELWQGEVDAMIERTILLQDALVELLRAASERVLTDMDRKWFRKRGQIVKKSARTALDAMRAWHGVDSRGRARPTWGIWSRRLDDGAIVSLCRLLGGKHGETLDAIVGGKRYGGGE